MGCSHRLWRAAPLQTVQYGISMTTPMVQRITEATLRRVGATGTGQLQVGMTTNTTQSALLGGIRRAAAVVKCRQGRRTAAAAVGNSTTCTTRRVSSSCERGASARGAIEVLEDTEAPATAGGASLATRKKPLNGYLNKV